MSYFSASHHRALFTVCFDMLNLLLPATFVALAAFAGVTRATSSLESTLANSSIDILYPGNPGYHNASLAFNRRLHFEPFAIAYPNSTKDVAWLITNLGKPKGIPGDFTPR